MSTRQKESVGALKMKVEELEKQVADYKKRLDDLRKAKNTTILKREREVLEVGGPNLGQKRETDERVAELQKQLDASEKRREHEIAGLEKRLEAQLRLAESQKKETSEETACDHEGLIIVLQSDNEELREQVEELMAQLSIKEATWCDEEEKLKHKLQQSWGEKYAEWMAATEQKMEELKHANNMMRQLLAAQQAPDQ